MPQQRRRRRNWLKAALFSLTGARPCPLCAGGAMPAGASHMHAHLRCRSCGLTYVADLPSARDLTAAYQRVHDSDFQVEHKRDWAPFVAHKADTLDRLGVEADGRGRPALDLGCGEGALLGLLRDRGWDATGLELNPVMARQARARGHRALEGSLEDPAPPATLGGPFELVLMNHIVEHLRAPQRALSSARAVTAAGGSLVLETPLNSDFRNIDHLYYFSAAALELALTRAGFEPVSWYDYVDANYGHHNLACRAEARPVGANAKVPGRRNARMPE